KVRAADLSRPTGGDRSFAAFLDSLPDILEARSFRAIVDALAAAARNGRGVLCMMGGHVVKTGLTPVLIDLMERGVITHLASNGSAVIHDYELARWGGTSEDVEAGLADGTFGMAEETGREMNEAIRRGAAEGRGLGEALADALDARRDLAYPELSLLLAARRRGGGLTVHAARGAELSRRHPAADGAAIGQASYADFRRLVAHVRDEAAEIRVAGLPDRRAVGRGVPAAELGAPRGVDGEAAPAPARGEQQRELGIREVAARVQRIGERLAQPAALRGAPPDRLVHLAARLLRHAERAVGEPGLDVLAGAAPARQLVVVDHGRAVGGEVRDDAALHEVDQHGREPGLHDVPAHHAQHAAAVARRGRECVHDGAEAPGLEDVGERIEER